MMAAPVIKCGLLGTIPVHKLYPSAYTTRKGDELTFYQTQLINTLGSWVYNGAFCLAKYMESDHFISNNGDLKGKKIIEIGAGVGNVGVMAGCYGANCIVTDLEPLVALMEHNIKVNAAALTGNVRAQAHCWGDEVEDLLPVPDFLVLANCVYYRPSLDNLLESTLALCGEDTTVLACYELRSPEIVVLIREIWHGMAEKFFHIEEIPEDAYQCKFAEEVKVLIVKMKKKKDV